MQLIFLKKLDRVFAFPTIGFFSDLILFVISIFTIDWIQNNIRKGLSEANVDGEDLFYRKLANF